VRLILRLGLGLLRVLLGVSLQLIEDLLRGGGISASLDYFGLLGSGLIRAL
jgi:hypothetical protein